MHNFYDEDSNVSINHHGDHSGDAIISIKRDRIYDSHDNGISFKIPNRVLRDYVLDWIGRNEIALLEDMTYDQLFERYAGKQR